MYKPLFMLLMGLVVFIGFMVGVIPTLSATSEKLQPPGRAVEHNALMQMMVTLSEFLRASGPALGVFILLVSVALFFYGRTPAGRLVLYGMLVKVPLLGGAVVAINFALWARYMALMWRAGYADIAKAVAITKRAMPEVFHEGLDLYSEDLARGKGLGASCDPERLAPNDPRLQWPMFLQVALQISEKTMETDTQLTTASAYLEEDAELLINRLIEVAKIMALVLVACSAALPIIGYMFEVVTMVSNTLSRGIR
jgi:type II secretory pathway component PulF